MRVARLFLKAVKLPPHVLFREVVRKLRERYKTGALRKRALAGKLSLSDDAFRRALKGKGSLKGFLRRKREGGEGTLSLHGVREAIEENFGEYKKGVVGYADEVCSHRFDLLGSGPVDLAAFLSARGEEDGSYLPWHWDFKSGYRWERETFYKDIRYGNVEGQDVKVPWELSRFQHLFPLGQAYVLTGDEKYAGEFVREVDDWITCNPSHLGVNWACTMDVGIRAANWLLAWPFFRESKVVTDAFARRFFKSILQHGRFIRGNLEWSEVITSNHYLSNIAGLLSIALLVPELRESRRWREFAVRELVSEMEKQVYDDGMDFEASTCYHRLVLELFFFSALLCRSHGIELPESFLSRLRGMFDVVLRTVKPNGRMPQIGDNDSGRFHIFCDRDSLDATYLLTFGALFFDSPEYRVEGFGFAPEALWLFGADAYERWLSMPPLKMEELGSARLLDGGLYVMRWGGDYMIVSCGLNGQNDLGGHAHNDKLSFELCIDGREVIVDPGTYVYTPYPDERNRFRGTASHNTVMIDGEEQNRFTEGGVFGLHNDTGCRCLHWGEDDERIEFEGVHYGYRRLKDSITHRRGITFDKGARRWEIVDDISGGGRSPHDLKWRLCFHPQIKVMVGKGGTIRGDGFSITVTPPVEVRIEEGWYSKGYGSKEPTQTAVFEKRGQVLPFQVIITIDRFRGSTGSKERSENKRGG